MKRSTPNDFSFPQATSGQTYCLRAMNKENWRQQTLRMSLALSASGRWSIAHLCTGRRAYSARDGGQHAPRPLVAAQYGLSGRLRPPGKPGGWSRPDFGLLCYHSLRRPAAHKLLFPLVLAQFPAYGVFCALAWRKGRGIWATMWILMTHLAVGATASLLCRVDAYTDAGFWPFQGFWPY